MDQIKDRLKQLRHALGLKQRDIAEKLKVNVGLVGSWECGRQDVPDYRIDQICTKYNVNRDWLERGEGEMFEPEKEPNAGEVFRDLIVKIYDKLPTEFQALWRDCAQAILTDGSPLQVCPGIDRSFKDFSSNNSIVAKNEGDNNKLTINVKNG